MHPCPRCAAVHRRWGLGSGWWWRGGFNKAGVLDVVEVMDAARNLQWSTVEPLPLPLCRMQSGLYSCPAPGPGLPGTEGPEALWYLVGDRANLQGRRAAFCVSLRQLVGGVGRGRRSWVELKEPPYSCSGIAIVQGFLITVGGKDVHNVARSEIHLYFPGTNEWLLVGRLPVSARHSCACASLSDFSFLVVGGREGVERSHNVDLFTTKMSLYESEVSTAARGEVFTAAKGECWVAPSLSGPLSHHLSPHGLQNSSVHIYGYFSPPPGHLRGVDVVAETSFEVTRQAHTYEWRGYGVKLHVQQYSLPADCPQCRVEMRASLSGQYALPANCELVSGVYWVYCPVKFSKRTTLEVQHCSTRREGLSFVRAECTQEQLPYVFRRQEGGVFSEHSSHGSIELSRFSGWGILKRNRSVVLQQYSAQVYYSDDILNTWKVLFAVRRRKNLILEDTVCVMIMVIK